MNKRIEQLKYLRSSGRLNLTVAATMWVLSIIGMFLLIDNNSLYPALLVIMIMSMYKTNDCIHSLRQINILIEREESW